jgi:hypothetical protein
MPGGRTLGRLRRSSLSFRLPAGLLPLPRDQDRHEPAVNAGGVRSVSPTTSSATSAGAPARPAEQPRRDSGVTEHALLRADKGSRGAASGDMRANRNVGVESGPWPETHSSPIPRAVGPVATGPGAGHLVVANAMADQSAGQRRKRSSAMRGFRATQRARRHVEMLVGSVEQDSVRLVGRRLPSAISTGSSTGLSIDVSLRE